MRENILILSVSFSKIAKCRDFGEGDAFFWFFGCDDEQSSMLWQRLRNRQVSGHKFRRQCSIDRFIVDFFCSEAALIVEVDGSIHDHKSEPGRDREEILKALDFRILRFTNDQVLHHMDQVVQQIMNSLA